MGTLIRAAVEHEESSKTLFYVLGGVLAAWAVLVSAMGIAKPGFASNDGAARGVMALTAVLMAGAMVAAIVTG